MTMTQHALPDFPQKARLAQMRERLIAPARSIVGYQEIIFEDAQRLGLTSMLDDLARIRCAAQDLVQLVNRLLDTATVVDAETKTDLQAFQARLRHDLRTPLNAIIGYAEMLLEELEDVAGAQLREDLERLLNEARQVLQLLDVIVDFSNGPHGLPDGGDAEAAHILALQQAIRPAAEAPRALEPGHILVVDDNENNRELLRRRLEHEGHKVAVADSGHRALKLLSQQPFEVILLDLMMPDMNGLELLQRLRQDERWRRTPVIMISGLSATEAVIRCIEAGADDYLSKPFDPVLLRARINAGLERKRWHDREQEYLRRIEAEKERADALLRNILPGQIVNRLNGGETAIADRFEAVTVLFADLVGFSSVAARMSPARLVDRLNRIFTCFDVLVDQFGVEKIKTIGDAYMAAAGLPEPRIDHADVIVELAFRMLDELDRVEAGAEEPFQIRIGIHTGPVIAGVIGRHKFIYDIWGDTVNIASRLEGHGIPNQVQVSNATCQALRGRYDCRPRGMIDLKGIGPVSVFLLHNV